VGLHLADKHHLPSAAASGLTSIADLHPCRGLGLELLVGLGGLGRAATARYVHLSTRCTGLQVLLVRPLWILGLQDRSANCTDSNHLHRWGQNKIGTAEIERSKGNANCVDYGNIIPVFLL
jgi:hypothetical protein